MKSQRGVSLISIVVTVVLAVICFTACTDSTTQSTSDVQKTLNIAKNLEQSQPTPTDINYSLERYNLIRRAYWVNGQREKANTLICEIEKPLGYIALLLENGACVGNFIVDGKITSLNSYLTPDSEYYEKIMSGYSSGAYDESTRNVERYSNKWLADVDGSYGANDTGIFFFTPDGKYIEWTGTYLYSDIPFEIKDAVVTYKEVQ